MSEVENSEVIREFCEAYNRHDLPAIMDLCADSCVFVDPTLARHPKCAWERLLSDGLATFPDGHLTPLSLIAERHQVALEFDWNATEQGEPRGVVPMGRAFDLPGVFIFELADTRITLAKLYSNTRFCDLSTGTACPGG